MENNRLNKMNSINYMAGPGYDTRMHAPQDACWDALCPLDVKSSNPAQEKLACFKNKLSQVCDCCNKSGLSDCEILIPGQGLVDPCKLLGKGSGDAKNHFCDCVNQMYPNIQTREQFLKNQDAIIDCCRSKCNGGSCDYDCSQIGLNYLTENSYMGACPSPETPASALFSGSPSKSKMWIYISVGLIIAIIILFFLWYAMKKHKRRM